MAKPVDQIVFEFFNPTDALAILVTMSPLAADARNLQLFARHTEWYEDFSDGARMHRVQNAIPPGTAALSSILFFDGINRDVKGIMLHNVIKCYQMARNVKKCQEMFCNLRNLYSLFILCVKM